jgi:hypothetical protein
MADLNALIAEGPTIYRPDPLGQYAKMQQLQAGQQQMRTAALQEQSAGMQLQQLKEDRDNMAKLSQKLSVKGLSPRQFFEALQTSGDSKNQQLGIEGLMKLDATEAFDRSQQTIPGQTPARVGGELGSGTAFMDNAFPGMPAPVNALASRAAAPAASTNALAPTPAAADPAVSAIEAEMRRIQPFVSSGATGAKEAMARLEKRLEIASKRYTVGDTLMGQMGNVFGTAPAKAGSLSTLARLQNELAALPPGDPRRAEYVSAIRKETQFAPTSSTTVNMPVQEKAEQGKRGEMLIEEFKAISASARNAAKNLPALETQERILNEGFKTGFGSGAQKAGASVLAALGVPEAEKYATSAETFNAAANNAVLQKQLEQKGTQSQSDADRMEKTIAQLGNTVESNKFIISIAKAQLKRDIEQRNFYSSWYSNKKTYDGAEDAWFNGEGGKSLFDRPELKAYKQSTAAPAAAPAAATQGTGGFKYLGVVPTEGKK